MRTKQGHELLAGVPFCVVATIMGWSPSTTVRMARRYGHIGQTAQRQAVNALKGADFEGDGAQKWAHSEGPDAADRYLIERFGSPG